MEPSEQVHASGWHKKILQEKGFNCFCLWRSPDHGIIIVVVVVVLFLVIIIASVQNTKKIRKQKCDTSIRGRRGGQGGQTPPP